MYFYIVNKIGDGTEGNPVRPNIADGISFAGGLTSGNSFLICTQDEIPTLPKILDLLTFCNENGFSYSDVMKWSVGD